MGMKKLVDPTFELLCNSSASYKCKPCYYGPKCIFEWARVLAGFRQSLPHDFFVIAKLPGTHAQRMESLSLLARRTLDLVVIATVSTKEPFC
jgi:hypothetical protein